MKYLIFALSVMCLILYLGKKQSDLDFARVAYFGNQHALDIIEQETISEMWHDQTDLCNPETGFPPCPEESGKLEFTNELIMTSLENIAKNHNPPPVTEPAVFIYPSTDGPGEYVSFPFSMDNGKNYNDQLFYIFKELICSENPYAKELVAKYKITSDTIECN